MAVSSLLALDVGERRIGVAWADATLRMAFPLTTLTTGEQNDVVDAIRELCADKQVTQLVVGLPRNQQGEETAQTQAVKEFARRLTMLDLPIAFQDESLTSVHAEAELKQRGKPYTKGDIDSLAATFILQDYLQVGRI